MSYFLLFLFLFLISYHNPNKKNDSLKIERLISVYYRMNKSKYKNLIDVYQRLTLEELNQNLKCPLSKSEEYEFKKFKRAFKAFPKQTKENK